jgi:hypothetical protein
MKTKKQIDKADMFKEIRMLLALFDNGCITVRGLELILFQYD